MADLQQVRLVALPRPDLAAEDEALDIDTSLAGLAYRTQQIQQARDGTAAYIPMIDGVERVGVLRVTAARLDAAMLQACKALADLSALLVVAKSLHSELLITRERTQPMSVQSELLWAFLPPRTIGTTSVTSSAVLEPAYEVGGDAFDHSLDDGTLHLTLLDAMGHDLASGGASAIGLATCRATRRSGGTLPDIATAIDRTLEQWLPGRLMTGVIADLDSRTGRLTWINCGHPPPLLVREGRVLPHILERTPQLPLGLGFHTQHPPTLNRERLQPGDRILLYSDGVTEARSPAGDLFGEQRLGDAVIRSTTQGDTSPEALRRLIQNLLAHQKNRLRDDATLMLAEWHPTPG
ncbi:PP2C family protein-serine/threonine phosphatase [Streptomyces sp. A0592]|uniref:PP2C family protein-serine/threonine phosphatase n=1 Tax=Streptomyces sp. A0592 TaxID=2563099 RepID=UPI001F10F7B5|nr:PP2C family protein-serine/threonine phosphatase [Streptomyces sp. A0592]